jgi:hypothetical protein
MVTKARTTFCPDLAAGGAQRQAALDRITAGEIIAEGTSGFGVLALLPNGTIIGDALPCGPGSSASASTGTLSAA